MRKNATPYIIIPALNEGNNIGQVLDEARRYCLQIIVVDDGSSDNTAAVAEQHGALVLSHAANLGKGAALKTGCDYAYELGAECFILMDSDGQHDAREIPKFLELLKGRDIVFGYRKLNTRMPLEFRLGNFLIQGISQALFHIRIRDTLCGYKAFTRKTYERIRWMSSDYFVETEIVARTGMGKLTFCQVPIETIYRDRFKGTTPLDGIQIVINMIWWKLTK